MMQGMAFGAGSEIAHTALRGVMGGHHAEHPAEGAQQYQQSDPCMVQSQDFMNCLQNNRENIGMCQSYLDMFKSCRANYN